MRIPQSLAASCRGVPERETWLAHLPETIRELSDRWSLKLGDPFDGEEVSAAWVAPVSISDGSPAVLKLGMPHFEAEHERAGLRLWNGYPTVRLLDADDAENAMLLEKCEPGTNLRELPESDQDVVIAGLLREMWRRPPEPHPFRPLAEMTAYWSDEARRRGANDLVEEGLRLFDELSRAGPSDVLLATDLHAGNVLRAERRPWLVIDPKPFIGDPAYDATQHLLNCRERLAADGCGTIRRFAELLELDAERVHLWTFARLAAEPSGDWDDRLSRDLARRLAR